MIFINLVISMNSLRWVHIETYQRRSVAERHVPLSASPLGVIKFIYGDLIMKSIFKVFLLSCIILFNFDISYCQLTVRSDGYGSKPGFIDQAILVVEPHGAYVEQSLYLSYSDHNQFPSSQVEIVHRFELPAGAVVNDLWLWIGDSVMQAIMLDTWTARSIYDSIVSKHRDPAFLSKNGNLYELHIYPLISGRFRKIKMNFITPTRWLGKDGVAELPLKMLQDNNTQTKPLNILFREVHELWGQPAIKELPQQVFGDFRDTSGYIYKRTDINNIGSLSSLTLEFATNFVNGSFITTSDVYNDATYFQFGFNPGSFFNLQIDSISKHTLFALDLSGLHNKNYATLIPNVKQLMRSVIKTHDSLNILVAGAGKVELLGSTWKIGDTDSINNALDRFAASDWGSQIAQEKKPNILYTDGQASTGWQFPGLEDLATFYNYSNLGETLQNINNADVIAAYEQGYETAGDTKANLTAYIAKVDSFFAQGGRFLTYYDYNRVGNEVLASHYIPGLTTIRRADRSGTLYRNVNGNIGKYFPESIVHYGFDTLQYTPDPNVKIELQDQDGHPVVISKKVSNGLLVVSAIWSMRDDGALKKLLGVPLLGLNAVTKNQLLTNILTTVQSKYLQSPFDKVIVLSNSDSLFQKNDAINWSQSYFNAFDILRPTFTTINLLDGTGVLPVYLTDNQIQYYGSGYLLKTISHDGNGRHFETHLDNWTYINSVLNAYSYPVIDSLSLSISVDNASGQLKELREVNPIPTDPNKARFFIGSTSIANKIQFNLHAAFINGAGNKDSSISVFVNHDTTTMEKVIPSMLGNEKLGDLFDELSRDTTEIVQLAMRYHLLCDFTALIALEPNDTIRFMKNPFDESGLVNVRQLNDDSKIDSLTLSSYPNPFNNRTNIVVNIKNPSFLNVYIYNILGQLVKVVAAADYVEGKKIYSWDGNSANNYSVSSGVYFIRLIAKEKNSGQSLSSIRKILLLK
jgi:hypothetical protein